MKKRRVTILLMIVAVLLTTVAGVALAKAIQCKPNKKCEGTRKADTLTGTPDPDRMYGLRGDDLLFGVGGSDKLFGGNGSDFLDGGPGDQANDQLDGGASAHEDGYTFVGAWGEDTIVDTVIVDPDSVTGNSVIFRNFTANLILNLNSDPNLPEATDGTNTVN